MPPIPQTLTQQLDRFLSHASDSLNLANQIRSTLHTLAETKTPRCLWRF